MECARCRASSDGRRWCVACERAYDTWVRHYASDMIKPVLGGSVVVMAFGVLLPLLGIDWLVAGAGAVAAFGTLGAMTRVNRRRRRREFQNVLPRAALVDSRR